MVDYLIIGISSISFFFFVIGLMLLVRAKGQAEILLSMKRLFLTLSLMGNTAIWVMLWNTSVYDKLFVITLYMMLFWAMSFTYILGLFGIPLTSVRIQFLLTLVAHGVRGADMSDLMKEYSKDSIVGIRLLRLVTSGEIIKKGNSYMLRSRWSYFVLHNYFLLLLLKIFRPIPINVSNDHRDKRKRLKDAFGG